MPSTISSETKVDISGRCEAWIKRKTGRDRKWPASTMPATMASVTEVAAQAGRDCTKLRKRFGRGGRVLGDVFGIGDAEESGVDTPPG